MILNQEGEVYQIPRGIFGDDFDNVPRFPTDISALSHPLSKALPESAQIDPGTANKSTFRLWLAFFGLFLLLRVLESAFLPMMDFSEARYAEMARKMVAYNDWITLWFTSEQPFWGKPPLAFWSFAAAFKIFGQSEFAARLPSLLCMLATSGLVYWWANRCWQRTSAILAAGIFLSCWLVMHSAGVVITDPALTLSTTAVMIFFWQALETGKRAPAYWMWFALGMGLLAKGPVALVICGLACGAWVMVYGQWLKWWRHIRLFSGLVLMLCVASPWYYAAEMKTPGFLEYFLVGEHYLRFTEEGWTGDLYGGVKDQPAGTIWAYLLFALLPWSLIVPLRLFKKANRQQSVEVYRQDKELTGYLYLWAIAPVLFFTFSENILVTYVLPALPACALLIARHVGPWVGKVQRVPVYALTSAVLFFTFSFLVYEFYARDHRYNQKPIIDAYYQAAETKPGDLVYFGGEWFSAIYYTADTAIFGHRTPLKLLGEDAVYFVVRDIWRQDAENSPMKTRCEVIFEHSEHRLWYCPAVTGDS